MECLSSVEKRRKLIENSKIKAHLLMELTFRMISSMSALDIGLETRLLLVLAASTFSLQTSVKQQDTKAEEKWIYSSDQVWGRGWMRGQWW